MRISENKHFMLCVRSKSPSRCVLPDPSLKAISVDIDMMKESDWTDALQIYMLLGEVIETVEHLVSETPFPHFAGVFASRSYLILAAPLHPLYTKINNFVHKGPQWKVDKLPSYWIDKIILQPPTEDDGYRAEIEWLLDILLDGLRTANVSRLL